MEKRTADSPPACLLHASRDPEGPAPPALPAEPCGSGHTATSIRACERDYASPQLDHLCQPALHACLRCRWAGSLRQLAQRQRRVAKAQRRRLAQRVRQALQLAGRAKPPRRVELPLGGARRADEVRMVCIREPVGLGAHLGDHAPLLEREDRVDDPGGQKVALDLLPALRIGARVRHRARSPATAPPPRNRRSAGTTRRQASASALRGAATAARSASRRRGTRPAGRRHDSRSARRPGRAAGRAADARCPGHPLRQAWRGRAPSPRRGAGSGSPASNDCDRVGADLGRIRAARREARTRVVRPRRRRGRGGMPPSRGPGDAVPRPCGTGPRSRPGDRSGGSARSRRAPPARRLRASPSSQAARPRARAGVASAPAPRSRTRRSRSPR